MKNRTRRTMLAAASALFLSTVANHAAQAAPKVATSIAPVYSITAAIMKDVGTPSLLIDQATSPHAAKLRPSDAKALQEADLVIWIGGNLTPSLEKPIETLPAKAQILTLGELDGLIELEVRTGGNWEKHVHDHDDHHDHDAHEEDHDEHEADHGDHEHDEHEHEDHDHDAHDHGDHDPHVWLDPQNGLTMAKAITAALSKLDAENADKYAANGKAFEEKLTSTTQSIKAELAAIKDKPYIVFHDAYHYYENRFGIAAVGSVMLQPGVAPGVARVREIRSKLKELNVVCIMAEPQFSDKILSTLIEGTDTKIGQLDPLGTNLDLGPNLYVELMRYNADKLTECLQ
ncbi:zinc ABC transporter substrate-binding protein [Cohaesibacter marisflavi]|nr:zinc ABC transporter substrate-binding protein [Cohaesibacter marisflavi]